MDILIAFVIGAILGGGIMFFVYRNNKMKMDAALKDTVDELLALKKKIKP